MPIPLTDAADRALADAGFSGIGLYERTRWHSSSHELAGTTAVLYASQRVRHLRPREWELVTVHSVASARHRTGDIEHRTLHTTCVRAIRAANDRRAVVEAEAALEPAP